MRGVFKFAGFLLVSLLLVARGQADEPAQEFLDALRDNGYYDVALDYLDSVKDSDLVSPEFRNALPFERARTLILSVAGLRDPKMADQRLNEAQQLLNQYATSSTSLETRARTRQYSGQLLSQRAEIYVRQSESDRLTVGEREQLYDQAREMLEGARSNLNEAKDLLTRLLSPDSADAIKIDPDDPSTLEKRRALQQDYTQVTVQLPNVVEKLADTFSKNPQRQQELWNEAIEGYLKVWDKYKRYPAGIQACIFAGRCFQKLGQHSRALEHFSDIFSMAGGGASKQYTKQAFVLATDSWQAADPYPHNQVIFTLDPIVRGLSRTEARDPGWLRVQLELALAKSAKAQEIKDAGGPTANSDARTMQRAAAKVLRNVARVPSPYRDQARELLVKWDIPMAELEENSAAPTNFGDALQLGRDQIAELESIAAEYDQLRSNSTGQSEQERAAELAEIKTDLEEQADRAIQTLDLAITLAADDTSRGDINTARYLQSYAYFASGRFLETAIIGEHLLEFYPREDGAQPASGLVVKSYSQLRDRAGSADHAYEDQKLTEICNRILDRWPGSNEAGLAAATMTRLSLLEGNLEQGRAYFEQVPAEDPSRGSLAIVLGRSLWTQYQKAIQADPGTADQPALEQQLSEACQLMASGINALPPEQITGDTMVGMLLLVNAYLARDDVDAAVKLLDKSNGPLDLVKQKSAAVFENPNAELLVRETYKTAIKTFLAAMQNDVQNQPQWVDRVNGILAAMKQQAQVSNDPADQSRLAAVYQLIAAEMKNGFDALKNADQKSSYAKLLSKFLGSIEESSDDGKTVLWAGATLMSLAADLRESGLPQQSGELFTQATSAFNRAETLGFTGESNEEALRLELRRQRALALRGSGQYQKAVDEFVDILKSGRSLLPYQIDAAETLQEWGIKQGLSDPLAEATGGKGDMTDPRTNRPTKAIWGWKKLVLATRSNEQFRDTYYLALYRLIEGRFEYGKIKQSRNTIESALRELKKEQARDETFHGLEKWKRKYGELQLRIESEL